MADDPLSPELRAALKAYAEEHARQTYYRDVGRFWKALVPSPWQTSAPPYDFHERKIDLRGRWVTVTHPGAADSGSSPGA